MNFLPLQFLPPKIQKYKVHFETGVLKKVSQILGILKPAHRYVIICDSHLKKIYGEGLARDLRAAGYRVELISFPAGERSKNESTKTKLDHQLLRKKCGRDTMILALGGGVTGDMAGFVASTYMRGIPYIHIPTSLLAMVDSSIGGKVGVDTPFGKNLIGSFWHPEAIIVDLDVLKTLPEEHFINGLFEIIKIFLTHDAKFFEYLKQHLAAILRREPGPLQKIIIRALQLKIEVIERDERENGERATLNFGHTFGHALEQLTDYKLLHGFAVAYGILFESKLAELAGILKDKDRRHILDFLAQLAITPHQLAKILRPFTDADLMRAMQHDKKNRNGQLHFVLLKTIGAVRIQQEKFVHSVAPSMIKKVLHHLRTTHS